MNEVELRFNGIIQELELQCNWLRTRCAELNVAVLTAQQKVAELEAKITKNEAPTTTE